MTQQRRVRPAELKVHHLKGRRSAAGSRQSKNSLNGPVSSQGVRNLSNSVIRTRGNRTGPRRVSHLKDSPVLSKRVLSSRDRDNSQVPEVSSRVSNPGHSRVRISHRFRVSNPDHSRISSRISNPGHSRISSRDSNPDRSRISSSLSNQGHSRISSRDRDSKTGDLSSSRNGSKTVTSVPVSEMISRTRVLTGLTATVPGRSRPRARGPETISSNSPGCSHNLTSLTVTSLRLTGISSNRKELSSSLKGISRNRKGISHRLTNCSLHRNPTVTVYRICSDSVNLNLRQIS